MIIHFILHVICHTLIIGQNKKKSRIIWQFKIKVLSLSFENLTT